MFTGGRTHSTGVALPILCLSIAAVLSLPVAIASAQAPPPPSAVVSPATVAPGGTLTVSWQGITTPTTGDWFGLFPAGAADSGYLAWWYTTGKASDSLVVTLPPALLPGVYEVRVFGQNGTQQRYALSNTFDITANGATLSVTPPMVAPNGTLTVS